MRFTLASSLLLLTTACVSEGRYDEAVAQTRRTHAELATKEGELEQARTVAAALRDQIAMARMATEGEATARAARAALVRELSRRIDGSYREIATQLSFDVGERTVDMAVRDGMMVLELADDTLFDRARADIKPTATPLLTAVAVAMHLHPTWIFQVSGLTDGQSTTTLQLSSVRAARVASFLVEHGAAPDRLRVAAFANIPFTTAPTGDHIEVIFAANAADFLTPIQRAPARDAASL